MRSLDLEKTDTQNLSEILDKVATHAEFATCSLREHSVRHLIVERLTDDDIKMLGQQLNTAEKNLGKIEQYINTLEVDLSEEAGTYITALKKGLEAARGKVMGASFDQGWLGNLWGEKVTLPSMVAAASYLLQKSESFSHSFESAMDRFRGQVRTVLRDPKYVNMKLGAALTDAQVPLDKLKKGLSRELQKSFGGSKWQGIKDFFKRGARTYLGDGNAVIKKVEALNFDPKTTASWILETLMDATVSSFLRSKPEEMKTITNLESTESALEDAAETAKDQSDERPVRDVDSGEIEKTGYELSTDDLKKMKQAMDQAKLKKQRPTRALGRSLNNILGKKVFVERKTYDVRYLLSSKPRDPEEEAFARWQELSGTK